MSLAFKHSLLLEKRVLGKLNKLEYFAQVYLLVFQYYLGVFFALKVSYNRPIKMLFKVVMKFNPGFFSQVLRIVNK